MFIFSITLANNDSKSWLIHYENIVIYVDSMYLVYFYICELFINFYGDTLDMVIHWDIKLSHICCWFIRTVWVEYGDSLGQYSGCYEWWFIGGSYELFHQENIVIHVCSMYLIWWFIKFLWWFISKLWVVYKIFMVIH